VHKNDHALALNKGEDMRQETSVGSRLLEWVLDPMLARPALRLEGLWYAGDLSPKDPRVSPLLGDLSNLPPMLVLTGTNDLLPADATQLQTQMA
jgi:acetyl esterase/lipase